MILFLGTKPGKASSKQVNNVSCPFCEQRNTLTAVSSSTYFHLFWISLFRISSSTIISCSHCKKSYYEDEFTEVLQQQGFSPEKIRLTLKSDS
ncbi:zinc-ribbon domain-containing protein [Arenibacter latericius]|uniref:zinc-ribbon domain-containing protein n=1 Tax=Arenibacter latericius TaxID=86104 RepID=UPI0006873322|nr:zinc-ribbon domain-containing protein [Arenibacter latericius]MDX1363962.1 zinc-ribbon domain-containing protein [Arenibacter latericius]